MIRHLLKLLWNRKGANTLLLLEVFLTLLVVFVVTTLGTYLWTNHRRALGFDPEGVWHVYLEAEDGEEGWPEMSVRLLRAVRALDSVEEAAFSFSAPYDDETREMTWTTPDEQSISVQLNEVSDEFRDVLGIEVLEGRWFQESDTALNWDPVIVDRDFARTLFGGQDPLGEVVELPGAVREKRVVGVIEDFREDGEFADVGNYMIERKRMGQAEDPVVPTLLIKLAPGVTADFEEELVETIQSIARGWYFEVTPMARLRRAILDERLTPLITGAVIAGFLMIMVGLGLCGVLWQNVIRRSEEIGVRRAVGASATNVRLQLIVELLLITSAALILGAIVGFQLPIERLVGTADPLIAIQGMVVACVLILLLSLVAGAYPSWLATRIEPVEALRHE